MLDTARRSVREKERGCGGTRERLLDEQVPNIITNEWNGFGSNMHAHTSHTRLFVHKVERIIFEWTIIVRLYAVCCMVYHNNNSNRLCISIDWSGHCMSSTTSKCLVRELILLQHQRSFRRLRFTHSLALGDRMLNIIKSIFSQIEN